MEDLVQHVGGHGEATSAATGTFRRSGRARLNRYLIGTVTGLLLGILMAALDRAFVGTAEPRVFANLSGLHRDPWVATSYLLCSIVSLPIGKRLSDLYGRKWFFLSGAALFVFASALNGAAGHFDFTPFERTNQLFVFRGLQGIGAGMIMAGVHQRSGARARPTACIWSS